METVDVSVGPADTVPSMGFAERLLGVFISPGETFADVARKPGFIAPLITSTLASVAIVETMLFKINMEAAMRAQLEQGGQASRMSPEQLATAVERGAVATKVAMHIGSVVGPAIFALIIAGLGLLVLNLIFGEQAGFKVVFSATCYAYLVALLGGVVTLPVLLFGDPENLRLDNPAPTNVGFFLNPRETSKPLYALATSADIFTVWFLIVVAIGLSEVVRRKVKPLSIFLSYFGVWMVWVLGKVLLSMLMH